MNPNLLIPLGWVAVSLLLNALIFALGWNDSTTLPLKLWWQPPGAAIGAIWVVLIFLMGVAHARLRHIGHPARWGVVALLVACLAYPFYTLGLQGGVIGLWGNLLTLLLTVMVMLRTRRLPGSVPWLLLPLCLWLSFAAMLTTQVLTLNHVAWW